MKYSIFYPVGTGLGYIMVLLCYTIPIRFISKYIRA